MIKVVSECVSCGLPCLYEGCPYYRVPILVCDECGDEGVGYLYLYNGEWLCEDCIKAKLPSRFDEDCYETEYLFDDVWMLIDEVLSELPTQSENDLEWYDGEDY